jgi:alkylation response protein AidB-like acyl-CoA dehydrogenase
LADDQIDVDLLDAHAERMGLVARRIQPYVAEAERDRTIPAEVRQIMAESGCFSRTLPSEYGGAGEGLRSFAVQQEKLAGVWPTAAVAATWANLSGRLLALFGTADQKAEWLGRLSSGEVLGAVAWTERTGGSDAAAIKTTATRVDGGWELDGEKWLIDNTQNADFFVVGARHEPNGTRRTHSMFLIRPSDPGFERGGVFDTVGLRSAGVGWFTLRNCFVPDEGVVGTVGNGFGQMMDMVEFGRVGVAAICLGMCEAALDATVRFLAERHAFGKSLADNDAILAKVADLRVATDAARLLTERAAKLVDDGVPCAREAAMAKLFASELATQVTTSALQLHGGIGYTTQTPIERLFRDSPAFTIGEGTSEIMRLVIGRGEFARVR